MATFTITLEMDDAFDSLSMTNAQQEGALLEMLQEGAFCPAMLRDRVICVRKADRADAFELQGALATR